jgi:hypothetical protein
VIQRYTEVPVGIAAPKPEKWRLSDGRAILAKASGEAGDRSHYLWARPGLIPESNRALIGAGSFIRLYDAGEPKAVKVRGDRAMLEEEIKILADRMAKSGAADAVDNYYAAQTQLLGPPAGADRTLELTRVLAEYVGPGADQGRIADVAQVPPSERGGGAGPVGLRGTALTLPSDCNKAARVIMGVVDDPVNGAPPRAQVEVPVTASGPHARRDFPATTQLNLVDQGGVSALATDLIAYAAVVPRQSVYAANSDAIDRFIREAVPRLRQNGPHDEAWIVFQSLPAPVRQDFAAWSGIDAAAAPQVGEALVTYRLQTSRSNAMTVNLKAYVAMRDALATHIASTESAANLLEQLKGPKQIAEKATAAAKEILQRQREAARQSREIIEAQTRTIRLNEALFEFIAGLEVASNSTRTLPVARDIAAAGLAALDITQATTLGQLATGPTAREGEVKSRVGSTVADVVSATKESVSLWNKHWAGIVMVDGSDYASLENDASTDTEQNLGKLNTGWGFALYGRVRPGQSFHEQMMATGDFGNVASTTRHRRPG